MASSRYFANVGPDRGPVCDMWPATVDVFGDPGRRRRIGTAVFIGWNGFGWVESNAARWRLVVDDREVPGPWIILDREFRLAEREHDPSWLESLE